MSNNFLKFIVIFLAILIVLCFIFLIYGLYSKISNTEVLSNNEINRYSLKLEKSEKIEEVKIINENNLLVVISDDDQTILIIYNLKENKVVSRIGK
tara:strand:- start:237 stop:524 length:288 start_codon:yes stop_codon:yes gene_type:complete